MLEDNEDKNLIPRSADFVDMASDLELAFNAKAVYNVQQRIKPEHHPDFNGKDCLDCEDPLTVGRLEMGRIRCVGCQEFLEKKGKLYGSRTAY